VTIVERMAQEHWDSSFRKGTSEPLLWQDLGKGVKSFQMEKMQAVLLMLAELPTEELITAMVIVAEEAKHG
jgi:hypothetical protein